MVHEDIHGSTSMKTSYPPGLGTGYAVVNSTNDARGLHDDSGGGGYIGLSTTWLDQACW